MLGLGLVTSNTVAAEAIEQLAQEAGIFDFRGSWTPEMPAHEVIKAFHIHDPELILLDLSDWSLVGPLVEYIRDTSLRGKLIGFRTSWTRAEQIDFEHAGIAHLLREPFSPSELDMAACLALHGEARTPQPNLLVFLPAKAGGGCSTTALNTAAALGAPGKRVLVIEGDARSGVFSLILNITNRLCLHNALEHAGEMTMVEWEQIHVRAHGLDLLLADPSRPVPRASWVDYFHLLEFAGKHYDSIVVDLPEILNDATAEVARTAGKVFVVCTPEVLPLKLASLRCQEIEAYGVPRERVHVIVTRWQRDWISLESVEKSLGQPVFATLSNDYRQVYTAILESRLASPASAFGKDCRALARKISGEPEEATPKSHFGLLRKLAH